MPTRIFALVKTQPIWMSETVAVDENGQVSSSAFDNPTAVAALLDLPDIEAGPTIFCGAADSRVRSSLYETVDSAELVFQGRVGGVAPGSFRYSGPLYRLALIHALKGRCRRGFCYVFLQIGTVHLGSRTICMTDPEFPVPTVGKRVLVFTSSLMGTAAEMVEMFHPEDIVIENADGDAVLAPSLAVQSAE